MRAFILLIILFIQQGVSAMDWEGIPVPANPGAGYVWELHPQSDHFNYNHPVDDGESRFFNKWTDFFLNEWSGPGLTVWDQDAVYAGDGVLKISASRLVQNGVNKISTGCITSKTKIRFPVYVETRARISNSVLASDVWMLSPDSTQEIDILEAYGSGFSENVQTSQTWFAERLHLSHHVFIREPFQDYQPKDSGTWYYNGTTWRDAYHRIGVHWKDPWNLDYYIDGLLVRSVSGESIIDPDGYTCGTGLTKAMHVIINVEDQDWRSSVGITPTDKELENTEDHTFKVDWIRVYKPVVDPATAADIRLLQPGQGALVGSDGVSADCSGGMSSTNLSRGSVTNRVTPAGDDNGKVVVR